MSKRIPRIVLGSNVGDSSYHVIVKTDELNDKIKKAQYALDSQIMQDMTPYMPMVTGTFIAQTKMISAAWAGSGKVCGGAPPMGRFLNAGKVMVYTPTGSTWAPLGGEKDVTDADLTYNTNANPMAGAHWFERAKAACSDNWLKLVKNIIGGK